MFTASVTTPTFHQGYGNATPDIQCPSLCDTQWQLENTVHGLFKNFILGIFFLTKLGYGLFPKFTRDYGLFRPPP